jgi:hypothetical protein
MNNLIDTTWFVGELNIPDTGNASVQEAIGFFVTRYQDELLCAILGYPLYKAFAAAPGDTSNDAKWKDLREGSEFTDAAGQLRRWIGLKNAATKRSIIANYVYFFWMRNRATSTTSIGERTEKSDGSVPASPAQKQCRAWNEMSLWIEELILFLQARAIDYPEFASVDTSAVRSNFRPINPMNI